MKGDAAAAEVEFDAVLATSPDDPRALTDLGIAQDLQEHHTEAQAAYSSALKIAPDLDAARVNFGLSLALSGQSAAAVEMLRPLAAGPNAPKRVKHDLATAMVLSGDHAEAEKLLRPDLTPEQVPIAIAGLQQLRADR